MELKYVQKQKITHMSGSLKGDHDWAKKDVLLDEGSALLSLSERTKCQDISCTINFNFLI